MNALNGSAITVHANVALVVLNNLVSIQLISARGIYRCSVMETPTPNPAGTDGSGSEARAHRRRPVVDSHQSENNSDVSQGRGR